MMKMTGSENFKKAVKTVERLSGSDLVSIREGILLGSMLESKKGEIYLSVMECINAEFKPEVVQNSDKTFSIVRQPNSKGEVFPTKEKGGLLGLLIREFPEYPVETVDGETGPLAFTTAQRKERAGELSEESAIAVKAINRFNSWASGYAMQLIREHINTLVHDKVAKRMEEIKAKAEEKGTPILDTELEKREQAVLADCRKEFKQLRGVTDKSKSILDAKGHVKETKLAELPQETKKELIKSLVTQEQATVAAVLTTVTGKDVTAAPKLDAVRTTVFFDELISNRLSDFDNPKQAHKLLAELKAMLISEKEVPIAGETGGKAKVKGRATSGSEGQEAA